VVAQAGTCACHVHVGAPSRDLGVQVLPRLRPWLAPLLAITANSPVAGGHDTGRTSWRHAIWSRWPTATQPEAWPDAAAYDTAVRRLIGRGTALDKRGTGAGRQRALFTSAASPPAFINALARATLSGPTSRTAGASPGPGSRQRQAGSSSVSLSAGREYFHARFGGRPVLVTPEMAAQIKALREKQP